MKKFQILLAANATDASGGLSELEKLRADNARLTAENAELTKVTELEAPIREKMAAGLTREQAESVVKQQADTDKEIARLEAEQKKAAAKK